MATAADQEQQPGEHAYRNGKDQDHRRRAHGRLSHGPPRHAARAGVPVALASAYASVYIGAMTLDTLRRST
jgi:hypothetical protein